MPTNSLRQIIDTYFGTYTPQIIDRGVELAPVVVPDVTWIFQAIIVIMLVWFVGLISVNVVKKVFN